MLLEYGRPLIHLSAAIIIPWCNMLQRLTAAVRVGPNRYTAPDRLHWSKLWHIMAGKLAPMGMMINSGSYNSGWHCIEVTWPLGHLKSQVIGLFVQWFVHFNIIENVINSALLSLCGGAHRWPMDSPHKGPVIRKAFQYYDIIMLKTW